MAEDVMERWKALVALARDSRLGDPTPHSACIVDFAAEIERLRAERDALLQACRWAVSELQHVRRNSSDPGHVTEAERCCQHALATARGGREMDMGKQRVCRNCVFFNPADDEGWLGWCSTEKHDSETEPKTTYATTDGCEWWTDPEWLRLPVVEPPRRKEHRENACE